MRVWSLEGHTRSPAKPHSTGSIGDALSPHQLPDPRYPTHNAYQSINHPVTQSGVTSDQQAVALREHLASRARCPQPRAGSLQPLLSQGELLVEVLALRVVGAGSALPRALVEGLLEGQG